MATCFDIFYFGSFIFVCTLYAVYNDLLWTTGCRQDKMVYCLYAKYIGHFAPGSHDTKFSCVGGGRCNQ